MRDQFWALFTQVKHQQNYASLYRRRIELVDKMLTIFCLITSTASITAWGIWQQLPWLWSVLVGLAQILQIIKPELPLMKHVQALRYAIPEYRDLASQVEAEWLKHCNDDDGGDAAFHEKWLEYKQIYTSIETKYFGDDSLIDFHGISEKATQQTELYCKLQNYIPKEVSL